MTRILTPWNWRSDPGAPRRWPDPERRIVLVEPDLWDGPIGEDHAHAAAQIAALERRKAIVIEPTRDPARMAHPTSIAISPGIVPALVAGTQAELDAGLPGLLAAPAAHRALLLEPREAIDLSRALEGERGDMAAGAMDRIVDWVIARGGAEPMHPAWIRGVCDQCADADIPLAFLSWGEWLPAAYTGPYFDDRKDRDVRDLGEHTLAFRVGAALSGCLLDGRARLDSPWGALEVSP